MTATMQEIPWEHCLLEPRHDPQLQAYMKREMGTLPPGIEYFSDCPWLVRSLAAFNVRGAKLAHLDLDMAEFVGLVVSQDHGAVAGAVQVDLDHVGPQLDGEVCRPDPGRARDRRGARGQVRH